MIIRIPSFHFITFSFGGNNPELTDEEQKVIDFVVLFYQGYTALVLPQ